ncbi:TPA: PD-(D/E)XK nuclease-like domain-containing protein [Klebsiella pneumoniae]|uniref:RecE family exodeoxyribonuclease n=2 Tax=Klebsiella pneumoniae TaxID=573 RepID=UPI000C7AD19F|nr:RecE family exodeoxyribonuclease [Klebsiella pneumoniae]MCS5944699.1 PD-(D/E)XK nuclease-like domain-containing protein [Klebsiella pneumoniae subsp. pneumoniae]PLI91296.1 exodeoxyribonuclease [Klebsiella pneumoniae]HBS1953853.1 PD-(D/E)XK nuclease-like domain-containing protein [Klebsiella pneumoniae]HBY8816841.1 PD-(D/E)XK nuclease-like domain-containing protein [Klebsiella pneumoniae]HBY9150596.1 PD-(D/E)XK nuclease-like domain-containing protein [Klebsiella pneumoniae]
MEYFYLIKATQKSGKADAVIWRTNKSEARALLQLDVDLEDAGIETGRGKDYQKPIRTDFPVFNDLPAEGVLDYSWCERYQLGDDGRTWALKPGQVPADHHSDDAGAVSGELVDANTTGDAAQGDTVETFGSDEYQNDSSALFNVAELPFRTQLLAQYMAEERHVYHISMPHRQELSVLEMDTDNAAVQDLILAAENIPEIKKYDMPALWKFTSANKKVFPEGKRHELGKRIQFAKLWFATNAIDRGILTREWAAGNCISSVLKTDAGTNAGGGNKTDRNPDYTHTLDTLDVEIALATMPMDFDIYNFPASIHRRAKEIVQKKESPFKEWSAALRKTPGILDYSRAAIFALIREASSGITPFPDRLRGYINANLTEHKHDAPSPETLAKAGHISSAAVTLDAVKKAIDGDEGVPDLETLPTDFQVIGTELVKEAQKKRPDANQVLAAERGEYVEGISDPTDPKWITEDLTKPKQPEVSNMGNGVFSIDGLMDSQTSPAPALSIVDQARQRAAEEKLHPANSGETTSNVQMETAQPVEDENDNAVSAGEGADEPPAQTTAVNMSKILAERCPDLTAEVLKSQVSESAHSDDEGEAGQAAPAWPEYFEPGRYEGVPNEIYHAANGISSTMVKDARVSLMYFEARHVSKTIQKVRSPVLDMGNLVHALALQPEQLETEFSIEPEIPEGAFTTTATIRAFIEEYNNGLPVLLSADDIKRFLEEYNATLPAPVPLGGDKDAIGIEYLELPDEFKRIVGDDKNFTASAMKACIKEYNATLPAPVKTSGSRDALLEQLALINPDMVAQEAQKPQPLKVSGTKADLIQAVKSVKPDAVFADELLDAWRENPEGKVLVTRQQLATALAIQKALLNHPTAGKLLMHPSRAVEVSYFGIDEETGLEVRVRPDLEIDMGGLRIGADLKTISMWNIKQEGLRAKLHREIIERDYHLSAAMYCDVAALDQFYWIFVNKDENYHWIAIIEASEELLELGMLEYRKAMRAIANGFDTGDWPAPITEDYAEELNDFDMRRLEALRVQA